MYVDKNRATTMRRRLGEASKLILSDQFLPMFRNRQINYPDEFEFSVAEAARKRAPSNWLSAIWKPAAIKQTLATIRKMMNLAKAKICEARNRAQIIAREKDIRANFNAAGRAKYEELRNRIFRC
jgi:hypothetical protein